MPTDRQNLLAANLLRGEANRLRNQAHGLEGFVVEETPQEVRDEIASWRRSADEYEQAAEAFSPNRNGD
jgi:hypothetical protein